MLTIASNLHTCDISTDSTLSLRSYNNSNKNMTEQYVSANWQFWSVRDIKCKSKSFWGLAECVRKNYYDRFPFNVSISMPVGGQIETFNNFLKEQSFFGNFDFFFQQNFLQDSQRFLKIQAQHLPHTANNHSNEYMKLLLLTTTQHISIAHYHEFTRNETRRKIIQKHEEQLE